MKDSRDKRREKLSKDNTTIQSNANKFNYTTLFSLLILDPVFVQSRKGNVMIQYGAYKFSKQFSYGSKTRWQCSLKATRCEAFVMTYDNLFLKVMNFHNHDPE